MSDIYNREELHVLRRVNYIYIYIIKVKFRLSTDKFVHDATILLILKNFLVYFYNFFTTKLITSSNFLLSKEF